MTNLHTTLVRATEQLKGFYQGYVNAKSRRRVSHAARSCATIHPKRSFVG
jgi:hypothetical protein